jgi:HD-like signal output (HDOD) protein
MNVLQRVYEITELPTLPEIFIKVQELINSDAGNAEILSRIIQQDPSLSAKVLKVANSAFFNPGIKRVSSLSLAIARIGFTEIRNITTAITFIKHISKRSDIVDYRMFWRHSLSAAYLTQTIAAMLPKKLAQEDLQICFLSGLLHDAGILVYDQFFHEEFEKIVNSALTHENSFLAAEQEVSSKETHALIGSALLEIWRMDSKVISGVRFHHAFERAPVHHSVNVALVYLSEYILCNWALGSFEGTIQEINEDVWNVLSISPDSLGELFAKVEIQVERADIIMAIETGDKQAQLRLI